MLESKDILKYAVGGSLRGACIVALESRRAGPPADGGGGGSASARQREDGAAVAGLVVVRVSSECAPGTATSAEALARLHRHGILFVFPGVLLRSRHLERHHHGAPFDNGEVRGSIRAVDTNTRCVAVQCGASIATGGDSGRGSAPVAPPATSARAATATATAAADLPA